ncbi:uncharacterized protein BJ171DRAFT_457496 [Polychytrium aggregatum]|uniref:uncharacterized protein n=1 Tax=Polychytrium aggregatum TaxID=110093 RepID=UPI0022FDDB78|nr:uncharacterized protein BJ171DRAFT_457496 [Polychytrium aggregatum]KAI9206470.1 hypothetical protein BJ171DRAFT_457496 [Polychytrium aggregatum]
MFFGGYSFEQVPNLTGKVAIVTGANAGLGRASAMELARKGAHVILACRTESKALPIVEEIKKETGNANVEFMELDLSSIKSVERFSKRFLERGIELDILMNNAAILMPPTFTLSVDQIEMQLATNHIGHFLLTLSLIPAFPKDRTSRIVNVSSRSHQLFAPKCGFDLENYNNPETYNPWVAYGQSKVANILFTQELQARLEAAGYDKIYVNALNPGAVATDGAKQNPLMSSVKTFFFNLIAVPQTKGALTQIYVATSPDIETKNYRGQYFDPVTRLSTPSAPASDKELAKKLWELSVKLIRERGYDAEWVIS